MRALLGSLAVVVVLLGTTAPAASDGIAGEKPPVAPPVKLDPPAAPSRPIAIHDGTRDGNGPGRNCEPTTMGQLECKASAIAR